MWSGQSTVGWCHVDSSVSEHRDGTYSTTDFLIALFGHSYVASYRSNMFLARDSMLSVLYAIACPSVRTVRPSVTRVDQSKTVAVRIMQFSPYSSPIPLVFTA